MSKIATPPLAGLVALATSVVVSQVAMASATAAPSSAAVFAEYPSTVTIEDQVPWVGYAASPPTLGSDWSSAPGCALYADAEFDAPLTAIRTADTYTAHCIGGSPLRRVSAVARTASGTTFTNRTLANSGLGDDFVYGVFATDDTVYAATNGGGLSISTDGGTTFTNRTLANSGLGSDTLYTVFSIDDTVYAGTSAGLSISTDGGATFTNSTYAGNGLANDTVFGVYVVDDTIYAATLSGLSISTDSGSTFTNKTSPASGLGSNVVLGVYATDDTVYAATNGGLSISTDGGATFTNRTNSDGLGTDIVLGVYATDDTVYAAVNGGLSISTDGGVTFTNRTTADGLGHYLVHGVYATNDNVYAATYEGLSISTDGGATFANATTTDGLGDNTVYGVYATDDTVYAATHGGLSIAVAPQPAMVASPDALSVAVGAIGTVTVSSADLPLPDGTAISAVSATPGAATLAASVSAASGNAVFAITGVSVGTSNVSFSAVGYATVVVPVTVSAPQPGPTPVSPPSAPAMVSAVASNASAVLTWTVPVSAGSFPVSTYQADVSPGDRSCLVTAPALTCTITGLSNGITYTAKVRALNGAGWGPYSTASNAFAPVQDSTPSITISGTRSDVGGKPGVSVTGATTGVGMGAILQPWIRFPGQPNYTQGTASIHVDSHGHFAWQRRTAKRIYISIRSVDRTVESNRLIIRAT